MKFSNPKVSLLIEIQPQLWDVSGEGPGPAFQITTLPPRLKFCPSKVHAKQGQIKTSWGPRLKYILGPFLYKSTKNLGDDWKRSAVPAWERWGPQKRFLRYIPLCPVDFGIDPSNLTKLAMLPLLLSFATGKIQYRHFKKKIPKNLYCTGSRSPHFRTHLGW